MKRVSCIDLALGFACDRIFEAETDDEVLEQALAHAREEHGATDDDRDRWRELVTSGDRA